MEQKRNYQRELEKILEQIKKSGWEHELIFVNDGSADNSLSILEELAKEDHDVKLISFSRNFGHEAAMIAGIDHSTGDGIICMDADLQHPPQPCGGNGIRIGGRGTGCGQLCCTGA